MGQIGKEFRKIIFLSYSFETVTIMVLIVEKSQDQGKRGEKETGKWGEIIEGWREISPHKRQ